MRKLPDNLRNAFVDALRLEPLTQGEVSDYQKWLRFYLDFCDKYQHPPRNPMSLVPFLEKLRSKGQNEAQQEEATEAIRVFYQVVKQFE